MSEQRFDNRVAAGIGGGCNRRYSAAARKFDIGAPFNQPLRDSSLAKFSSKIERGGAGEITRIDRRATRQQKVDHVAMARPRSVAERPGAKPVT